MIFLELLSLLLKRGDLPLEVFGKELQLVLDRYVLADIALVLLQLLLHGYAVLLRVHAPLRSEGVSARLFVRRELSPVVLIGQ